MTRRLALLAVLLVLAAAAAGCGSKTITQTGANGALTTKTVPNVHFAKTKFVLHLGLAFGAFHRYIYKPYQAGTFRSGAHGRLTAFIKAALAALFIKREIRLAGVAAQNSPALCKIVLSPLRTVSETVQAAVTKLKGGDASGIGPVQNAISQVESGASSQGAGITEDQNAPLS